MSTVAFHLLTFQPSLNYLLLTPFIYQDSSLILISLSPLNSKKAVLMYPTTEGGLCDYTARSQLAPVPRPEIYTCPVSFWLGIICSASGLSHSL